MGLDVCGLDLITMATKHCTNISNVLTLGRQGIYISYEMFSTKSKHGYSQFAEDFFRHLGAKVVDSIDYSDFEGCTIVHDMNTPVKVPNRYSFIFDGGCTEHIFNVPQVFDNIIKLLEVGGVFCSVTINNNFSGHGFYQFSPEVFIQIFQKEYGMELLELYLAEVDSDPSTWVNVKTSDYYRQNFTFNSTKSVYILTIARKLFDSETTILTKTPQQNSYKIDWGVSDLSFFPTGGLGNLLFCHNAAFAFAKEQNLNLKAAVNDGLPERPSISVYRDSIFKHLDMVTSVDCSKNLYIEPEFTYREIPSNARVLQGYFQSYKYTEKYQDEITDLLKSNCQEIISKMKTVYGYISQGLETICVHVRRGDYLALSDYHTVLDEEYYVAGLSEFDTSDKMVLVFSENPKEIEHWKVWQLPNVHFVHVPDPLETLWLMSMCTHFIIANSSLSLQAYYMRENKSAQIEYPNNWFGPSGPKFDMNDLIRNR